MEDTELRLFKDIMDKQIDTFSNMTREIATLVERQQTVCTELKIVTGTLKNIEFGISNGLRSKIRDDLYTLSGECIQECKSVSKSNLSRLYLKIVLAFSTGFIILTLVHLFGG